MCDQVSEFFDLFSFDLFDSAGSRAGFGGAVNGSSDQSPKDET
jgi:hypothetical protein